MPLANRNTPRRPVQRHGRARCIEQSRTVGKSTAADRGMPCWRHGRRPSPQAPMQMLLESTFSYIYTFDRVFIEVNKRTR